MQSRIPSQTTLVNVLDHETKAFLYNHFQGAADPERLIYIAWMFANGWMHDPPMQYDVLTDPKTGDKTSIPVLNLNNDVEDFALLYEHWRMEEILGVLKTTTT